MRFNFNHLTQKWEHITEKQMNIEETRKQIAVMQAWCEGKQIEARCRYTSEVIWVSLSERHDSWNWHEYDYRIKPAPLEIQVWVTPDGEVVGASTNTVVVKKGSELRKFREVIE